MANINQPICLNVNLPSHQYKVLIGLNLLSDPEVLRQQMAASQVLIVTNKTIEPLYLERVKQAFSLIQCDVVVLADGELYKNQHSLSTIYDSLIDHHHHRDTTVLALGGGVIGDLAGFAAATYQRGVRLVQLPTTLLAQVDSSIGGKTAINYGLAKNMIGSFYQPQAVIIDVATLKTLPLREFRSGFAEIIKYGLLVGGAFLKQLIDLSIDEHLATSPQLMSIIAECCKIKATIIQQDEREQGKRALLNLGHTFAHALEAITNYQRWLHGEAVAMGLYCAALLSHAFGYLTKADLGAIDLLLVKNGLPNRIPADIDINRLRKLMWNDKKIKNNTLRFVLMRAIGDCYVETNVTDDVLNAVLMQAVEPGGIPWVIKRLESL